MGLLAGKTLATAVAPGDTSLRITPPLALGDNPAGQPIQIGTELMMVTGGKRGLVGLARAADSAHTQGSAITELNPFVATAPQEGGAALTVDNGTDPPAPIATIDAPGAVIDGDVATFPSRFYAQTTDPGAVGAGAVWKDTTLSGSSTKWWERNAANDGWDAFAVRR
ncbi:MAG TPA: hypothetical protein VEW95_05630, partial [Candidatus Limnocylindrales bacterium]|nr:hypothetical protein [Candidatus Limnocylindrales bacterium]